MTTAEVLQKARDLIADESRWTQGSYAKNEQGYEVEPTDPTATCFCALGAALWASGTEVEEEVSSPAVKALDAVRPVDEKKRSLSIPTINDVEGHAAVLALYDRAIAAEQAS